MQEFASELALSNPMFIASGVASLIGLTLWFLYRGFITENFTRIQWLRRLLFPHLSLFLRKADKNAEGYDLSKLYVETVVTKPEHAFDLYLPEDKTEDTATQEIGEYLISEGFRPEVILTSLAEHPKEFPEMGNFVLTAPRKTHPSVPGYGIFYELFHMLISKRQLHVRFYHNTNSHSFEFFVHEEYNPYNPLYAKRHFDSEEFSPEDGVELIAEYEDEIAEYGVELQ